MNSIYKIEKLDHQGRGIVRENGKVIFVENALPEEVVQIEITKEKKNWKEAIVKKYEKVSVYRKEVLCPYYKKCGGCDVMHMPYEKQLIWKEEKVHEIMHKFIPFTYQFPIKSIVGTDAYNYRNKATFQVNQKIGYFTKNSKQIVPIASCQIVDDKINELLQHLLKMNIKDCNQIMIRTSKYLDQTMIVFHTNCKIDFSSIKPYVTSIYVGNQHVYGTPYIQERIGNYLFHISPQSFFQVNSVQVKNLYDVVLKYANLKSTDSVLDLYCGTGTIGIFVSAYCKRVIGVEMNEQAILNAKENQMLNHVENIEFICGDVSKVVDKINENFQVVIVDPPRSGLDSNTISYLKKWKVNRIVYVSCDPVTLARDLKLLSEVYDIVELTPVDMFPETYHVECVCVLNKR